jgi:hypothetical protein
MNHIPTTLIDEQIRPKMQKGIQNGESIALNLGNSFDLNLFEFLKQFSWFDPSKFYNPKFNLSKKFLLDNKFLMEEEDVDINKNKGFWMV